MTGASQRTGGSDAVDGPQPVIGLTAYSTLATWGQWQRQAALLPSVYLDAVLRAGGTPVLLPPSEGGSPEAVRRLDALILTGGPDVDPAHYGQEPHPSTLAQPERDAAELADLAAALDADLPVLAVCRGMQLLHVARGGALTQHLPDEVGHTGHRPVDDGFSTRQVQIRAGSTLAATVGPTARTSCHHHQAVRGAADGLESVAWDADGTVEGVEMAGRPFVVGVQWHPEEDPDDTRLFGALVHAARAAMQTRV